MAPQTVIPDGSAAFVKPVSNGNGYRMYGSSSGDIGVKPPTTITSGDYTAPSGFPSVASVLQSDASGNLSWIASPLTPFPGQVTGLTGTANYSAGTYALSWTAVTGAASYNVYRSSNGISGNWTLLGNTTSASYTDSTPTITTNYWYCVCALSNAGAIGPYATPIEITQVRLYDLFSGSNGTALTSHTPNYIINSNAWTNQWGSAQLDGSGDVTCNTTTGYPTWAQASNLTTIDPAAANYTCTFNWNFTSAATAQARGFAFRFQDTSNMFILDLDSYHNQVTLYSVVATTATQLGQYSGTLTTGKQVSIVCNGTSITVTWNGNSVFNGTNSNFTTKTPIGVYLNAVNGYSISNLYLG